MILSWNVRGLNDPKKQRRLKQSLRKFHVSTICLLKTHVKQENSSSITGYVLPGWKLIANYTFASLGRIWVLFNSDVRLEVYRMSEQAVHYHVYSLPLKKFIFLSIVYGVKTVIGRRALWKELCEVKNLIGIVPWIACGDSNIEHQMVERSDYFDGMPVSLSSLDFRQCLDEVDLFDLQGEVLFILGAIKGRWALSTKSLEGF